MTKANRLGEESSPYLRQHAQNPVHWHTWEQSDFEVLQKEQRLLIISIGYATCHWCHVMERECFESEAVATLMNRHFHAIKVDREERPDLDQIYMQALQLLTGQGGWPLNIVATPDGRPLWGATYLPKKQWIEALEKIVTLQTEKPDYLLEYACQFETGLRESQLPLITEIKKPLAELNTAALLNHMLHGRDVTWGGYQAPKFPMPVQLQTFLTAGQWHGHKQAQEHLDTTLTKMALGGIHDPIEGGFCRYAVDGRWHIPHFEKMGYDNGQLLSVYSRAYQQSKNTLYHDRINSIFKWLQNGLKSPSGGYYCAIDADSKNEKGQLEEGAYYVWTKTELQSILQDDFSLFQAYYNENESGYWEKDRYVLFAKTSPDSFAQNQGLDPNNFKKQLAEWHQKLYSVRQKRIRPERDTKILTSWNAMIAKGLCDAYRATKDEILAKEAQQLIEFLRQKMMTPVGKIKRVFGKESEGFLDDYAFVIQALVTGYRTFYNLEWLFLAERIFSFTKQHFKEEKDLFFSFKATTQQDTLLNPIEIEDNVIPSSNAVMTENQWVLGRYFDRPDWCTESQERILQLQDSIVGFPRGYAHWVSLALQQQQKPIEVVIVGSNAKTIARHFWEMESPQLLVATCETDKEAALLSLFQNRFVGQHTPIYICKNNSCQLPTKDVDLAKKQLQELLTF